MAIPDFQSLMRPVLEMAADGRDHTNRDTVEALAARFRLTESELKQLLPSGRAPLLYNRVAWAIFYLKRAGLLVSQGRGRFRIGPNGKAALTEGPERITTAHLRRYPSNQKPMSHCRDQDTRPDESVDARTPEEILEATDQDLRRILQDELLDRMRSTSPGLFERLVVDLLVAMNYGGSRLDAGKAVGRSGDDGIDGIIKEDKLGLDAVYIQAKRWARPVGRPEVQAFAGSLEGQRARKGVFITTSGFTAEARAYVDRIEKRIVLIDGEQLTRLMIEHNVGVSTVAQFTVKRLDPTVFEE